MTMQVKSHTRSSSSNGLRIAIAVKALSIVIGTLWIGNLVFILVEGYSLYSLNFIDLDLGILFLFSMIGSSLTNGYSITMLVLGWLLASIYVRNVSGDEAGIILVIAALLPMALSLSILTLVLLTITLTSELIVILPFVFLLLIAFAIYSLISIVLAVPGIILSSILTFRPQMPAKQISQPNYLVLSVIPKDKPIPCPFSMLDLKGCAFLGYQAPSTPLICDYESTWRRCYIYSHLYSKLDEELKK